MKYGRYVYIQNQNRFLIDSFQKSDEHNSILSVKIGKTQMQVKSVVYECFAAIFGNMALCYNAYFFGGLQHI